MSEERERVLGMLEEGKITADQAARLLEALKSGRPHPAASRSRHFHRRVARLSVSELDRIPDIVASAVSSAVKSGHWPRGGEIKTEFPGKSSLYLKNVSGDIEVEAWDGDGIKLESVGRMTRIRERDERVMIRSISGDIQAKVPHEVRLELTSVSGDVEVAGTNGRLGLRSVSGDVDLTDLTGELKADIVSGELKLVRFQGNLEVESKSGDIELEPVGEFSGKVSSKSGDIELRLRPDADVVLDMECEEDGEVSVDLGFPYESLEEGERFLKLKLGNGSRILRLKTRKADITVSEAKEE